MTTPVSLPCQAALPVVADTELGAKRITINTGKGSRRHSSEALLVGKFYTRRLKFENQLFKYLIIRRFDNWHTICVGLRGIWPGIIPAIAVKRRFIMKALTTRVRSRRSVFLSAAAFTALLAAGVSAHASTISATIYGTFTTGSTDSYGYLTGHNGTSLVGDAFEYTISYSSTMTYSDVYAISRSQPFNYSYLSGSGANSTAVSTLTIGTMSAGVFTPGAVTATSNAVGGYNGIVEQQQGGPTYNYFDLRPSGVTDTVMQLRFNTSAAYTIGAVQTQAGEDTFLAGMAGQTGTGQLTNGFGNAEILNYTITSAVGGDQVPEPASMTIFAVGAAGLAALRRRRVKRT